MFLKAIVEVVEEEEIEGMITIDHLTKNQGLPNQTLIVIAATNMTIFSMNVQKGRKSLTLQKQKMSYS